MRKDEKEDMVHVETLVAEPYKNLSRYAWAPDLIIPDPQMSCLLRHQFKLQVGCCTEIPSSFFY